MKGEVDLKQFSKQKRISKGSFGFVYQIRDKKTGEYYAAKIIDCDDDEDKCNEMVNREVNIMMYTKHPAIVKFIGYSKVDFQGENNVTIIMELAKNGSLRDVLRQIQKNDGPKDYTNTTRQIILVGIARGMKYLHDQNIIHRDIKPENILLDENFHPHITDFGLSKFFEAGHPYSQTKFGGTLAYEAPEILKKQKYDKKVDVYSFGMLMFEVLTDSVLYPKFESDNMSEFDFMNKIINQNYRPKFEVPVKNSFRKLMEKCWSSNPSDRPTFDEIFNQLANKEEEEDFLLENVDIDELNLYIEDVAEMTDNNNTEKLLNKISSLEEENKQLKHEIKKLKEKDKKQVDTINLLEEYNKKLKKIIMKLQEKNKKHSETNDDTEKEGHVKSKKDIQNQVKNEFAEPKIKIQEKQYAATIIVGGDDECNILGANPNNDSVSDNPAISPPLKSSIDSSSLLSCSIYTGHCIIVKRDGSMFGIGNNTYSRLSNSFKKETSRFTEFSIKDKKGHKLTPISIVCCFYGTLYLVQKGNDNGRQLVFCDSHVKKGEFIFLDIGDAKPVSLFGGCYHAAAICDKGEIIFINRDALIDSPDLPIEATFLPDGEKASMIACLSDFVVVLSTNGRVFSSTVEQGSNDLEFSPVSELNKYEIVWVSGTKNHCFAVTKDGQVFGRGYNSYGQLGIGKEKRSVSIFREISSLSQYKIRHAYGGYEHSLFLTNKGKILSCGHNTSGQLLLNSEPSKDYFYSPTETTIKEGATFCILGQNISEVFVGGFPPPNTPNMPIVQNE